MKSHFIADTDGLGGRHRPLRLATTRICLDFRKVVSAGEVVYCRIRCCCLAHCEYFVGKSWFFNEELNRCGLLRMLLNK